MWAASATASAARNAARAAYDDMIQGAAGIPWLLKRQGAKRAALCADDHRRPLGRPAGGERGERRAVSPRKDGRGQRVDVPMFEHLLQLVLGDHLGGYTFEPQLGEPGYHRILAPDRRPYETRDGYVCALIYNDKQWKAFFDILASPRSSPCPSFPLRKRGAGTTTAPTPWSPRK